MFHNITEYNTIAAIATPPGKGGIAIVKISGPDSISLAKQVFISSRNPEKLNRVMVYGHIVDNNDFIDEVLLCYMKSPQSYTGEEVVEIQCHGGYAAAREILGKLIEKGARHAEPGEFTKRAFLNGKIDLVQAESVLEIVSASGKEHLRRAEKLMEGVFSRRVELLLEDLKKIATLLELNIDFLQHDINSIPEDELKKTFDEALSKMDTMITSYTTAKRIKEGLRVVLSGKVNAGKSSLFNKLLRRKRAIVNTKPGTTRDWLEEKIELGDTPVNLIDTAGIRETEDDIEREGVRETERLLRDADIVVFLEEAPSQQHDIPAFLKNSGTCIPVISKSDLLENKQNIDGYLPVSSKTGEGIDKLVSSIITKASSFLADTENDSFVLIERHTVELKTARDALIRACSAIDTWSEEVIALELREAQHHIEAILGRNISFDILDEIFKNFCIGK